MAALGWRGATAAPAPLTLTAADVHVADYPTVRAVEWMGGELARATDGRIGLRMYHAGQIGREGDTVNLARFGALDLVRVNVAALNNAFPLTRVLALPYVFESADHLHRGLDGPIGREILDAFAARGLVGLAYYDSGARCFYNTQRPIVVPEDLDGLKIRTPPSDIFMDVVGGLGANATPLPYGDVFSALGTRLIDGAENNWQTFHTSRQFEVARYWSQSEHSYAPEVLLMSKQRFDALPPADRDLVLDAAARSVPYMRGLWDASEAASRQAVLDAGIAFNEVDRDAFRRAAEPIVAPYLRDAALRRLYHALREA
nr:TRAP transporter substrate-binding protein [Coralloluteibacterium stylophorae]